MDPPAAKLAAAGELQKNVPHAAREDRHPQRDGGVLCRRHPSAGPPDARQFAATLGISQPNATYKVNNLVAKGYLEKIPGEDRREVRLQTAGKFNAYYHDNEQALREAMDALAGRFSPEELDAAERVMQALVQTVETEKGD